MRKMSWRYRAAHPSRASSRNLRQAGSFPGPPGCLCPALLRLTWAAALLASALGDCGPPPVLPFAAPMTELNGTDFESGTVLKYVCRPGYTKTGSNQFLTCEDSGDWKTSINCVKKRCRNPGELHNGQVIVQTDLSFGSEILFSCSEGYILIGSDRSFCEAQGRSVEWSDPLPLCIVAKCAPPPAISNGRHSGKAKDFYPYGSSVTYICDPQYSLVGKASISCSMENKTQTIWIPSPPTCQKVSCPYPEVRHGKLMGGFRSTFHYKDSLEFDCDDGFQLKGNRVIHCEADGQWRPPPPICEQKVCCPKPVLKQGHMVSQRRRGSTQMCTYFYEDTITYLCPDRNYHKSSCQSDGTWSPEPTCENSLNYYTPLSEVWPVLEAEHGVVRTQALPGPSELPAGPSGLCPLGRGCHVPPVIAHGLYEKVRGFLKEEVHYTCMPGYKLVGTSKLTCNSEGWSAQAPQCKAQCERPEIEHGHLSENKSLYLETASVTVHCDSSYRLVGNQIITCSEDRSWFPGVPKCEWEFPAGCESVAKGWKLMQCLPDPKEAKLAQEMYKLSLEIQLLELQIEQIRINIPQTQGQAGPTQPPEL